MRKMNPAKSLNAKPRGLKRKTEAMIRAIKGIGHTPYPKLVSELSGNRGGVTNLRNTVTPSEFVHIHLPVDRLYIDSTKTPRGIKKLCMQLLIGAVGSLVRSRDRFLDSEKTGFSRIIASIPQPDLWDAQIVIFLSLSYYDQFFNRESFYQTWNPINGGISIVNEYNLTIPKDLFVRGYHEILNDEEWDKPYERDIWYIGEL